MRIESGFGKFNVGEEVTVQLLEVKYTKNQKPYARVLAEGAEQSFNVNIKESDAKLPRGRYKIVCTGVNEAGFCYVELNKLQHHSWDKYDEVNHEEITETTETVEPGSVDMAYNINLTNEFRDNLKLYGLPRKDIDFFTEHIQEMLDKMYMYYGISVIREMGGIV